MRLSVDSFLGRDEATWADFGVLAQPLAWALVCSSPQSWVGGSIPARAHPEMKPSRGKLTGNVGSGCP